MDANDSVMEVFEPIAILAAVFAVASAQFWWSVAVVAEKHGGDPVRVNRKLARAATATMCTMALAGASVLALPIVRLFE